MDADESGLNDISQLVIAGAITVLNVLGEAHHALHINYLKARG